MMSFFSQAYTEKENPSSPIRSLPLTYRRLVGAKAIKLGSWDKPPVYWYDLNVNEWHMRNGIKCDMVF